MCQDWRGARDSIQHNKISNSELAHVEQGTNRLLKYGGPEATRRDGANRLHSVAVVLALSAFRASLLGAASGSSRSAMGAVAVGGGMLTDEQGIVFLNHPAQQLEEHDE